MDSIRTQGKFLSFAVSAMLTSTFLATAPNPGIVSAAAGPQPAAIAALLDGARAAGFAGMKDVPAPAAVAAPEPAANKPAAIAAAPALTPLQIQKLRNLATGPNGHLGHLRPAISSALGVGPNDRDSIFPSFTATDDQKPLSYQIMLLPDSGYIVGRNENGTVLIFRLDANLRLLGAVTVKSITDTPTAIPSSDAERLLALDLVTWGQIADGFGTA